MLKYSPFVLVLILFHSCQSSPEQTKPQFGKVTESVYASVQVEPVNYYTVYPPANGIIEKVFVDDGDSVSQGQLIAMISASRPKLQVEDASIQVALAKEKFKGQETLLANILEEIELNKTQRQLDSINYIRQQNLWEQAIGSKAELEAKALKFAASQSQGKLLKKKYQQSKLELESMYKQSINALERAEENLEDVFIRSIIDGKVYAFFKNEGELVLSQEAIATIGELDSFLVKMSVDEVDIRQLALNQKALVSLDAYPDQIFELYVHKIYPTKDQKTQTFTVEAYFDEAPEKLFVGLTGEANIIIAESDEAIWIPNEYVFKKNKVKTNDGEVEVSLGLKNMDQVQVLEGIDTTTILLKP